MGDAKRRRQAGVYPDKTEKPPKPQASSFDDVSWEVVGDESSHPKTQQVLAALEQLKRDQEGQGGGKMMVLTLESSPRQPVVVVRTMGLGVFMSAISMFQELDLEDRLVDTERSEKGVDAAFS